MNTKLHAVTDAEGRPIRFFMTAGQVSDYTGAAALLSTLPQAEWLLVDRGYDADWFREALKDKGIKPCIPGRKSRGKPIKHDKRRYKRRNRIEIMFGRLKDWRRVATRYDRCPKVFLWSYGSVRGRGGLCLRAGGVTGVAIEDVGLWWSCELQPRTEETPDDRDQHALDRAFAEA